MPSPTICKQPWAFFNLNVPNNLCFSKPIANLYNFHLKSVKISRKSLLLPIASSLMQQLKCGTENVLSLINGLPTWNKEISSLQISKDNVFSLNMIQFRIMQQICIVGDCESSFIPQTNLPLCYSIGNSYIQKRSSKPYI